MREICESRKLRGNAAQWSEYNALLPWEAFAALGEERGPLSRASGPSFSARKITCTKYLVEQNVHQLSLFKVISKECLPFKENRLHLFDGLIWANDSQYTL